MATIHFDGVQLRRDIAGQILSAKRLEVCFVRREIKSGLRQRQQQIYVASSFSSQHGLTYRAAGVDIDAGDALVEAIKPLAKRTSRSGCNADLGGFGGMSLTGDKLCAQPSPTDGVPRSTHIDLILCVASSAGLFDLVAAGFDNPILVSGTDGVGTKLKVAHAVGKHDTIGIDLVAMCANDVLVRCADLHCGHVLSSAQKRKLTFFFSFSSHQDVWR